MMVNERESRHFVWQINEDNVDSVVSLGLCKELVWVWKV